MRSNLGISRPRVLKCQLFSFMPPTASAKVASGNSAANCSWNSAASYSFDGQNKNRIKSGWRGRLNSDHHQTKFSATFSSLNIFKLVDSIREGIGKHHFRK